MQLNGGGRGEIVINFTLAEPILQLKNQSESSEDIIEKILPIVIEI